MNSRLLLSAVSGAGIGVTVRQPLRAYAVLVAVPFHLFLVTSKYPIIAENPSVGTGMYSANAKF